MAYGIKVINTSGDIIVDNEYPVMLKSDTVNKPDNHNDGSGIYWFYLSGDIAPTGDQVLLLKPNVNQWISFNAPRYSTGQLGFSSNEDTLSGVILDLPENLAAPSGYGAMVKDSSGDIMWHSQADAGYITDGLFKAFSSYDDTYTRTFTDCNAGAFSGGGFKLIFEDNEVQGVRMTRTATNTIVFDYDVVTNGNISGGGVGSASYVADLFMMVGRIA